MSSSMLLRKESIDDALMTEGVFTNILDLDDLDLDIGNELRIREVIATARDLTPQQIRDNNLDDVRFLLEQDFVTLSCLNSFDDLLKVIGKVMTFIREIERDKSRDGGDIRRKCILVFFKTVETFLGCRTIDLEGAIKKLCESIALSPQEEFPNCFLCLELLFLKTKAKQHLFPTGSFCLLIECYFALLSTICECLDIAVMLQSRFYETVSTLFKMTRIRNEIRKDSGVIAAIKDALNGFGKVIHLSSDIYIDHIILESCLLQYISLSELFFMNSEKRILSLYKRVETLCLKGDLLPSRSRLRRCVHLLVSIPSSSRFLSLSIQDLPQVSKSLRETISKLPAASEYLILFEQNHP